MKTKILNALKDNQGKFISGEMLSKSVGVSRTAIWKAMNQLKEQGHKIDSQPKKGYRLLQEGDALNASAIESSLGNFPFLKKTIYLNKVDSTNTHGKIEAEKGAEEATLIIAEQQTGGRGRLGRNWHSPPGEGLWMSLILRPPIEPIAAPALTQVAASAMAKAILKTCGVPIGIKWPNDLWIGQKKVCGILTEMSAELSRLHYVVIGLGVNVNTKEFPLELTDIATSIFLESEKTFRRQDIVASFLKEFLPLYKEHCQTGRPKKALEYCRDHSVTLGRDITILQGENRICAKAMDITEKGELLIELSDGTVQTVLSGEVSLR